MRRRATGPAADDEAFHCALAGARRRDPAAWDDLFRSYAPSVAGYLRLRGANEPDDLTSEVFIGVVRGIARFHGGEADFRSWLFVIAHRRLQDEHRVRGRQPEFQLVDEAALGRRSGDVEHDVLEALGTERVELLCSRLAPDQADVLLLRLLADLTVDQVALVLGKSTGSVKQLQRRGFEAIRKIFTTEGVPL